jgi:hypothetical protein
MPNKANAIGRPSKLVISDNDIRILVKIGITSTNRNSGDIWFLLYDITTRRNIR